MADTAPVKEVEALSITPKEPEANGTSPKAEPSSPAPNAEGGATFKDQFKAFSKFGDVKSDGKFITLSQSDKWMKQAHVGLNKNFKTHVNKSIFDFVISSFVRSLTRKLQLPIREFILRN